MKHLLLIVCILIGSFSAANAGNGLTMSANDSAIAVGRIALNAKITQLQTAYTANPASPLSAQRTSETLALLREGMKQGMNATFLERDVDKNTAIVKRYYAMEKASYEFRKLSGDPAHNHAELLRQVREFYNNY